MGDQRYQEVKRIFLSVVDLVGPERDRALEQACAGDAGLRAQVQRLLSEDVGDATVSRIDPGGVLRVPSGPAEPERIGAYRILSRLGEGGFGVVYLAEQTAPVRRRVALKVIKPGMDSARVISRFEAERQALAMMDHPNIAKVLDAGTTPPEQGSRPYFAMEHVAGEPLTDYCDRHNLAVADRLKLFVEVCAAIQHAHAKGIIHRDIKPSNVLVSVREGGTAVPKVIDFGVAKALHRPLTEHTIFTDQGQIIGTPEYMSPEQAEMGALDIDTRSDVYSLGVLLYELLVGARPFDLRRAAVGELARLIREVDPPNPSTRLSSLGDSGTAVAARRRTSTQALSRTLSAELEWIPLKAMRKDRTERYQSAADLAADVGRYLSGQPLVAGPESAAYRARKFVRRHRVGVTVAALVSASLSVLGVVTVLSLRGALVAERERRESESARAEAERQRAQSEAERAAQAERSLAAERDARLAAEFVARLLGGARQWGSQVLFKDVVLELSARLERHEDAGPGVVSRARTSLGHSLLALGLNEQAGAEFERATSLAEGSADPEALADALSGLAGVRLAGHRTEEALTLVERAVEARLGVDNASAQDLATDQSLLGQTLWTLGRRAEAVSAFERAIALEEQSAPPRPERALAMASLAEIKSEGGDEAGALAMAARAGQIVETAADADAWLRGRVRHARAVVLRRAGRLDEARAQFESAVTDLSSALPPDHPAVTIARFDLNAARSVGLGPPASPTGALLAQADALLAAPMDPAGSGGYQRVAAQMFRAGDRGRALALLDMAIASARATSESDPVAGARLLGDALVTRSAVLRADGTIGAARASAEEGLATLQAAALTDGERYGQALYNAANMNLEFGDLSRATALCDAAMAHADLAPRDRAEVLRVLGVRRARDGRAEQGLELLEQARAALEALPPAEAWRLWRCDADRARCLLALGRSKESRELLIQAAEACLAAPGPGGIDARRALLDAADACEREGMTAEAARYRGEAERVR